MSQKKHILFIVNSLTAKETPAEFRELIKKNLDHMAFDFDVEFTRYEGHALKMAESAVAGGVSIVAATGGDGTVNEVARAVVGSDTTLAILPRGSGNGLARYLEIPMDLKYALRSLNGATTLIADHGSVNGLPFFNIAGVGFDARIANLYRKSGERGFKAYARIIATEFLTYKPRNFILDIDGKVSQVNALFISFANTNQFGYDTIVAPNASISDGLLDVVIFEDMPLRDLPKAVPLLLTRKVYKTDYVTILKGKDIILSREKGRRVNIDGESFRMGSQLHVRIHPGSLRLLVPGTKEIKYG